MICNPKIKKKKRKIKKLNVAYAQDFNGMDVWNICYFVIAIARGKLKGLHWVPSLLKNPFAMHFKS